MTTRMLIDARHREETRVAVVQNNRIEEFDFESAERKQLKGNIYLAKVTRVEPSLQAAFIDYGGNRHGFLAFSEIHPDYYQIPKEDRDALIREEAEHAAEEERLRAQHDVDDEDFEVDDAAEEGDLADADDDAPEGEAGDDDAPTPRSRASGNDEVEALRQRRQNLRRRYKIQDVIRRRQVLLVQVVKEERGNKGAALTTYLSLAGRYCVLMPNTSHGGGISRKISNAGDRKRLKSIMADLKLPASMGCIVRTAGLQRTRNEIKRDFDYLARLWDEIREATLSSSAPALVYGDSDLIKRAIRDIFNKDIDEVIVEGEAGYRQAKDFMRLLMPGLARRVKHYSDPIPLYQRAHVEDQLAAMYHPVVQLKSGGYLVINPTEALVSIDINSGRSTREHNIEQTATQTNLEAAAEIARQLRLRDMAGLVVIDFIDMDNGSNVRKVERAMKDALKNDRARIQVGRISSFGLMEMSRQRLRTGVLEASTRGCPHCEGTGLVRTASSAGLSALRLIEDEAARGRGSCLTLRVSVEAAVYVLNKKRGDIAEIEDRYGVQVEVLPDGDAEGARMSVEASGPPPAHPPKFDRPIEEVEDDLPEEIEEEVEPEEADASDDREERAPRAAADEGEGGGRRRRRRNRRGGRRPEAEPGAEVEAGEADADAIEPEEAEGDTDGEPVFPGEAPLDAGDGDARRRRGRRGRRGGRRNAREGELPVEASADAEEAIVDPQLTADDAESDALTDDAPIGEPQLPVDAQPDESMREEDAAPRARRRPRARVTADATPTTPQTDAEAPPKRRSRRKASDVDAQDETSAPLAVEPAEVSGLTEVEAPVADAAPAPRRRSRKKADVPAVDLPDAEPALPSLTDGPEGVALVSFIDGATPAEDDTVLAAEPAAEPEATPANDDADDPAEPPRRGWWNRTFGG